MVKGGMGILAVAKVLLRCYLSPRGGKGRGGEGRGEERERRKSDVVALMLIIPSLVKPR